MKVVIYWYDSRHGDGKSPSDIDLRLKSTSGSTLRASITVGDNKERVYRRNMGGQSVELQIEGFKVKTDDSGCGSNSMKVYWAWLFEDDARNDSNGPGHEIESERVGTSACPPTS